MELQESSLKLDAYITGLLYNFHNGNIETYSLHWCQCKEMVNFPKKCLEEVSLKSLNTYPHLYLFMLIVCSSGCLSLKLRSRCILVDRGVAEAVISRNLLVI